MNFKREELKKKIFLILYLLFLVLTVIGAALCITRKVDNAGYAVIPMLIGLIFSMLYRNSKKAIEENTK
ncbi:MAG: hypothetical protein K2G60_00680 [Oscillospiraceae bacterium]|nr:hypothetical protein [Oscillospiraceae bacterium]